MCGRYYIDEETYSEIQMVVSDVEQSLMHARKTGDVCPTDIAPVIVSDNDQKLVFTDKIWGYPGWKNKGVIFNARSESVMEKRMFQNGIRYHRAVVPAAGFYEWNRQKEKNTFFRKDSRVLYMAGFFDRYNDGEHFVILTTQSNASMEKIHDRMPLILEADQIHPWLCSKERVEIILNQTPVLLEHRSDYEQQSLFSM